MVDNVNTTKWQYVFIINMSIISNHMKMKEQLCVSTASQSFYHCSVLLFSSVCCLALSPLTPFCFTVLVCEIYAGLFLLISFGLLLWSGSGWVILAGGGWVSLSGLCLCSVKLLFPMALGSVVLHSFGVGSNRDKCPTAPYITACLPCCRPHRLCLTRLQISKVAHV